MPRGQLRLFEREIIACQHYRGVCDSEIAEQLGRHRTTVQRELKRNCMPSGEYLPVRAHQRAFARRSAIRSGHSKIAGNTALSAYVLDHLCWDYWSPDVISGRLRLDFRGDTSMRVCTQTVYNFIRRDQATGGRLHHGLAHGRKGYRKRGSRKDFGRIKDRVGIEQRPAIVDKLSRFGDWESDTIVGKGHRGGIATHRERRSHYLVLTLLPDLCADTFATRSIAAFRRHQKGRKLPLHTMTADNGKEFARHKRLSKQLDLKVYFAHPYSPWERARNENSNRMVRQWFPKGLDFRSIYEVDVQSVERSLNNRPRKSLGYRTPKEVLFRLRI